MFASWGDNITPPQQALDWIPDLYRSVEEIRLNEQTIVYCLHEKIGHLGIFVSASIAKRETTELASALELIETLPPGLYEAIITDTHPEMPGLEYTDGRYLIQFAPRTMDDILALDDGRQDEQAFEVVNRVSQINQGLYDTFASPIVKAMSNEATAKTLRETNPARLERWFFSDLNPWMLWVKSLADVVRAEPPAGRGRQPVRQGRARRVRPDRAGARPVPRRPRRHVRADVQGDLRVAVARGGGRRRARRALGRRGPQSATWEQDELKRLKRQEFEAGIEQGTLLDAWARLLIYVRPEGSAVDERPFNMVRRMIEELKPENAPSLAALKAAVKRQAFILALDEERAIAALPKLAPEMRHRRQGFDVARTVMKARGELTPAPGRALPPGREHPRARQPGAGAASPHERPGNAREVPAPDRGREGAAAGRHRGRPPVRRELALRRGRRREARADQADPGRTESEDRSGRRSSSSSTSRATSSSMRRTATPRRRRRSSWCGRARPRR